MSENVCALLHVALLLVALAILGRTVGVVWEVTYGDLAVRPVDSP